MSVANRPTTPPASAGSRCDHQAPTFTVSDSQRVLEELANSGQHVRHVLLGDCSELAMIGLVADTRPDLHLLADDDCIQPGLSNLLIEATDVFVRPKPWHALACRILPPAELSSYSSAMDQSSASLLVPHHPQPGLFAQAANLEATRGVSRRQQGTAPGPERSSGLRSHRGNTVEWCDLASGTSCGQ
jgi:hypothetical protein